MEFFVLLKFLYLALSIKSEFCSKIEVPSNFYGSPEVFSGYLPVREWFVEAFTLHEDVLKIAGNVVIVVVTKHVKNSRTMT